MKKQDDSARKPLEPLCADCQEEAVVQMEKSGKKVFACSTHWVELFFKEWKVIGQLKNATE